MDNKLMSITEWVTMEREIKPSYIDQILPAEAGEYIMVSGRTGIGKSILVLNMAFCLATGLPFYGFNCDKVTVGLLAMEGGQENIKNRLTKAIEQYPDCTDTLRYDLREPFVLNNPKNEQYFLETFEGCQVVILDNLRQVTTGKYLENNYAAEWIKTFSELLVKIGAVGVLTHHIKKPSGNKDSLLDTGDVYNLKGATEYVDDATTVLLLERKRQGRGSGGKGFGRVDNSMLQMYFAKHRIETVELPEYVTLERDFDKAGFTLIKEEGEE